MEVLLEEIASELPQELFRELNGGILLLPEEKLSTLSSDKNLFILGEYNRGGLMGRYITIYYGSFMRVYGNLNADKMRMQLTQTIKHEFTHHLESLAGEKDLEIRDAEFIEEYLKNKKNRS